MPEDPTRGVAGKSYLVTGAASGIGTAVTVWLSHHGARVALVDLNLTGAETAIRDNQLEGCVAIQADVTHEGDVSRAMDEAERAIGALSGVHLNAGYCPPSTPLADVELDDFEKTMAVNARSVFLGIRAAVRIFRRQGTGGSIVVTASTSGLSGNQGLGSYCGAKHAAVGLVRAAALDHAVDGVRVNAICPGETDTPMLRRAVRSGGDELAESVMATMVNRIPLGRLAKPDEMARAVGWLLSDEATYVTGTTLTVDGGLTTGRFSRE